MKIATHALALTPAYVQAVHTSVYAAGSRAFAT